MAGNSAANTIQAARYTPGGGWAAAAPIPTEAGAGPAYPQVAFDGGGNATASWFQNAGGVSGTWLSRDVSGMFRISARAVDASPGRGGRGRRGDRRLGAAGIPGGLGEPVATAAVTSQALRGARRHRMVWVRFTP
jgi:hypothetical protein